MRKIFLSSYLYKDSKEMEQNQQGWLPLLQTVFSKAKMKNSPQLIDQIWYYPSFLYKAMFGSKAFNLYSLDFFSERHVSLSYLFTFLLLFGPSRLNKSLTTSNIHHHSSKRFPFKSSLSQLLYYIFFSLIIPIMPFFTLNLKISKKYNLISILI